MKRSHKHPNQADPEHGNGFPPEDWWARRRNGFGMGLYRNTRDRKVAGVCAGLADHLNVDHWVIRLAALGGLIFFNSLMFFAYLGAWIAMAPRPNDDSTAPPYRYDEDMRQNRPINMFRYPLSPTDRLRTAQARMAKIVERTEQIERYVTSKRFDLDSEFSKMQK
jgi:phage shock protein C